VFVPGKSPVKVQPETLDIFFFLRGVGIFKAQTMVGWGELHGTGSGSWQIAGLILWYRLVYNNSNPTGGFGPVP
jgi:hypothetical protein